MRGQQTPLEALGGVLGIVQKFTPTAQLIILIGAVIWIQNTQNDMLAMKEALSSHQNLPAHQDAERRITAMETHFQYIRDDLKQIRMTLRRIYQEQQDQGVTDSR